MSRRCFASFTAGSLAVLAFAAAAPGAMARDVNLDAECRPQLTPHEQRLFDKAAEGVGPLRRFLFARRAIYDDLSIYDTAVWAERIDRRRAQCLRVHAQASIAGAGSVSAAGAR
jgi:hypothetical protein